MDETATVTAIIDGDTFDCSPTGRIRLADIDAPEYYEAGYQESKDALSNLIAGQTVYLDIDDLYGTDRYERWVAVVYVRHNATHLRNVNQALLDAGVAVVTDYTNEFNPYTWSGYVFHPIDAPAPSAAASADQTAGRAPLAVAFAAEASGGIPPYSFLWTFGDGAASSLPDPSHTYVSGGTFIARVTVTDQARRSGSASISIQVIGPLAVTVSASPNQGEAPLTVSFSATPSGGEPPFSFRWDLGDGNTSSVQNPSHAYVAVGTYTVNLTASDVSESSVARTVTITVSAPSPPEDPPPETTVPPSAGGSSPDWAYFVLTVAVGAAVAVMVFRTWRRRKVASNRHRPRRR
jgi:PKD repeat protein